MRHIAWEEQIVIDPDLHHGDPCIRGTRIPVSVIVGSLADGMTPEDIQAAYPQLNLSDIHAALAYAAQAVQHDIFAPFPIREAAYAHYYDLNTLAGTVAVANPRGIRVRRE